jgi:hypothetical protein
VVVGSARNGIRSESGWRRGRGNPAKLCPVIGRIGVHCAGRAGPPSPAQLLIIFRGIAVSSPAYLLHVQLFDRRISQTAVISSSRAQHIWVHRGTGQNASVAKVAGVPGLGAAELHLDHKMRQNLSTTIKTSDASIKQNYNDFYSKHHRTQTFL